MIVTVLTVVVLFLQYYSFTRFAFMLNELNDEIKDKIAPTDSRFRPDMRKMEEGDIGWLSLNRLHQFVK